MKYFPCTLPNGFIIKPITNEEYIDLCQRFEEKIFGQYFAFKFKEVFSEKEKISLARVEKSGTLSSPWSLCLGIFEACGNFVGWHYSIQLNETSVLMKDTGILPEYQGKKVYSELLKFLIAECSEAGFLYLRSTHRITNNQVIIPKLKAGFVIMGFEVDNNGLGLTLEYQVNPFHRDAIKVRSGELRPKGTLAKLFGLDS